MQTVKVYGVQDRRSTVQAKLPWVVRFTIDGRHRSKSFRTRIEADRYRGLLLQAVQDGGRFDEATGEPEAWQTPLADVRVHEWSRRWLAEQWQEWQPRTRASATEPLARFVTLAVERGSKTPEGLRVYLYTALSPHSEGGHDIRLEKWMARNCLTLGELDRERIADIDRRLGLKLDGSPMAANTANRIRIVAREHFRRARGVGPPTEPSEAAAEVDHPLTGDGGQHRSQNRPFGCTVETANLAIQVDIAGEELRIVVDVLGHQCTSETSVPTAHAPDDRGESRNRQ
jgi:hypothetical protein